MKLVSWNVNSLKVRLPQVLHYLATQQPDCLCLQETKLEDSKFPLAEIEAAGYRAIFSGQKTYNGVAMLARDTLADVALDLPGWDDPQRRLIAATLAGVRIVNVYVPNGQEVGSDKFSYKLDWLARLRDYLHAALMQHERLVVLGDFNIAPEPRDVYDPAAFAGQLLFSAPEHAALDKLAALGLADTLRLHHQDAGLYSWWDYRGFMFRRKQGLRIDLVLASAALAGQCADAGIDIAPRRDERPSDHAPVWAVFDMPS